MEEDESVGFANYSDREKPYGFCVSHARALFYKGEKVRYARESTAGINYIMVRHNKHTSYDICTSSKLWREFNELLIFPFIIFGGIRLSRLNY